jgi:uncharacterized protein YqjF (DUF2071 family)
MDLAFFHWPVAADLVRAQLPEGLELDCYEGEAWISVVPFRMQDVMLRGLPAMPGISAFPEINVRTYVVKDGKPGVWFFSLDANNALAVWAARKFFHLPYFMATMSCSGSEEIAYASTRQKDGAAFAARYRPAGSPLTLPRGGVEEWLSERYCLYACNAKGRIFRGEVHHARWSIQPIEFEIEQNSVAMPFGFELDTKPVLAHFSRHLDVRVWNIV